MLIKAWIALVVMIAHVSTLKSAAAETDTDGRRSSVRIRVRNKRKKEKKTRGIIYKALFIRLDVR